MNAYRIVSAPDLGETWALYSACHEAAQEAEFMATEHGQEFWVIDLMCGEIMYKTKGQARP